MRPYPELNRLIQSIEQRGVDVNNEIHGFVYPGTHLSFPGITINLCLSGTARIVYDMQEITVEKNNLLIMMPGHFMRAVSCSADFTYARTVISSALLDDIKAHLFSHDFDEFVNYYRKEQDRQWRENRTAALYTRFCDLVVEHHREHRDVQFYATQLGYTTRYFSKLFLKASKGISALEYIGQHVCNQAKRIMDTNPQQTVKTTALQLGFPTTGNFCRYFKRVTGIYPQEYKKQDNQSD